MNVMHNLYYPYTINGTTKNFKSFKIKIKTQTVIETILDMIFTIYMNIM